MACTKKINGKNIAIQRESHFTLQLQAYHILLDTSRGRAFHSVHRTIVTRDPNVHHALRMYEKSSVS
jgi:hypothetical protein